MAQLFNIQDDKVVINKLALRYLEGSIIHAGSLDIVGNTSIQNNLTVKGSVDVNGTLNVDTLTVKNLVTETGDSSNFGQWISIKEENLIGKGLSWTWGDGSIKLIYRNGERLWVDGDFDLAAGKSFKINNVEVISENALGSQITKSRLKEVGSLKNLSVIGNSSLGEFAFFNSDFNRVGINTDNPNGTLSIVENNIEFIVSSPNYGTANIGTFSNHNLTIVTDNTPRVTFKQTGEVVFGGATTKSANVTIYGTLNVDNLVSDTRVSRFSPLEFNESRDVPIYGQGLIWNAPRITKKFILRPDPDRLYSTESIDLAASQAYLINGKSVLNETSLGEYITKSKLTSVGVLSSLTVEGSSSFVGKITAETVQLSSLIVSQHMQIEQSTLTSIGHFSIKVAEDETYYADENEISIGNKLNTRRPVKMYGPVSIGVSTPDPTVKFSVNGDVIFNDKKFTTNDCAPTEGSFNKGDICWNQNPTSGNYIGWVCVMSGNPGRWAPFGEIRN